MENSQNTGVLRPISPEITLAEEKERKNREEQKGRRIEKNAMIALLGFILETFLNEEKKKCHTERAFLAVKFSKIHLDI